MYKRQDHVLVLDEGKLVDQGTHSELLTRDGPYREAWASQHEDQAPAVQAEPEAVQ